MENAGGERKAVVLGHGNLPYRAYLMPGSQAPVDRREATVEEPVPDEAPSSRSHPAWKPLLAGISQDERNWGVCPQLESARGQRAEACPHTD